MINLSACSVPADTDRLTARSGSTGESVLGRPVPGSDHFRLIAPEHETWLVMLETIREALGMV